MYMNGNLERDKKSWASIAVGAINIWIIREKKGGGGGQNYQE
jgi:hypothetical protein